MVGGENGVLWGWILVRQLLPGVRLMDVVPAIGRPEGQEIVAGLALPPIAGFLL